MSECEMDFAESDFWTCRYCKRLNAMNATKPGEAIKCYWCGGPYKVKT